MRTAPPLLDGTDHSALFAFLASGKRSVVCDLLSPEGQQALERELESADILIDDTAVRERTAHGAAQEQFALRAGSDELRDYQFGKKRIHHLFCPQCGVGAFSRGTSPKGEMVAVNVRCLDDVDIAALEPTSFDGRSL